MAKKYTKYITLYNTVDPQEQGLIEDIETFDLRKSSDRSEFEKMIVKINGGIQLRRPEREVIEFLTKMSKDNPNFSGAARFFNMASGGDPGAIAQMFVNTRTGAVFYFYGDASEYIFEPTNYKDMLDSDQSGPVKDLIRAWRNYVNTLNTGSPGKIESRRDDILSILEFYNQGWPKDLIPQWKREGFSSEEDFKRHIEDRIKRKQEMKKWWQEREKLRNLDNNQL